MSDVSGLPVCQKLFENSGHSGESHVCVFIVRQVSHTQITGGYILCNSIDDGLAQMDTLCGSLRLASRCTVAQYAGARLKISHFLDYHWKYISNTQRKQVIKGTQRRSGISPCLPLPPCMHQ